MKKNKKGFTLIELLAVIIIMGVLLLVAIPAVSKYMDNSRQSTYVSSVKSLVKSVSTAINSMEYSLIPGKDEAIIVPFSEIDLEKSSSKTNSPYGKYVADKSYIVVMHNGNGYSYYVVALDELGHAIPFIADKSLNANSVTRSAKEIENNIFSLTEIRNAKNGKVIETDGVTMKFLQEVNNIIKVKMCYTPYDMGDVIQLKDGSKYYAIQDSDEESKTVDLVTYYHMSLTTADYGKQSTSKTGPTRVFSSDSKNYVYENSEIYPVAEAIVANAKTILSANNIDLFGAVVRMPQIADFGCNEDLKCHGSDVVGYRLRYIVNNGDGSFWTTDNDGSSYVFVIIKSSGKASANATQHGIRIVIKNLLKSNIDKSATKALN